LGPLFLLLQQQLNGFGNNFKPMQMFIVKLRYFWFLLNLRMNKRQTFQDAKFNAILFSYIVVTLFIMWFFFLSHVFLETNLPNIFFNTERTLLDRYSDAVVILIIYWIYIFVRRKFFKGKRTFLDCEFDKYYKGEKKISYSDKVMIIMFLVFVFTFPIYAAFL